VAAVDQTVLGIAWATVRSPVVSLLPAPETGPVRPRTTYSQQSAVFLVAVARRRREAAVYRRLTASEPVVPSGPLGVDRFFQEHRFEAAGPDIVADTAADVREQLHLLELVKGHPLTVVWFGSGAGLLRRGS
jgi:hypothetical protein